ncbi:MAG: NAD(P)-binding domain-containing protein [Phaeodactylibacter sp.]|nr:NAD(P)-binding domain-containing protein [Phaeodactylibacter sp.]MCB9274949.1 NAD(P)-binding domain-containing protein [Lewinellaceae bacterium]
MPSARKVILIDKAHPYLVEHLTQMGYECHDHQHAPLDEVEAMIGGYFGLVIRSRFSLGREFLDKCTELKFIARMGIGLEHIDVEYAERKGIRVFNSPEGSRDTVAEHTVGLILGLTHFLFRAGLQVREGEWVREANKSYELRHRTVGIIGFGNIGSAVAQRLSSFGCRVIAYDKFKANYGGMLAEEVSLETIFREADIVTLHIPYADYNHHFVDQAFLGSFHNPIFLVNTSRGLVLDTQALVNAHRAGRLLGAALDVVEYEEQSFSTLDITAMPEPFQYLRRADNVILTPHTAGMSREVMGAHARVLVEKVGHAFGL